jgi:L-alanine-DL-glutamate epimerase-like enolase superfamily enzyme
MRIGTIRARAVRIPLTVETRFSTRAVRHRDYVLVWLADEEGTVGFGYAYAGTSGGRWLCSAVDELIAPLLVGRDAGDLDANWEHLYRELLLVGRRGGLLRALSAVDIAGWDRLGRSTGLPLRRLLGGSQSEIAAYGSGGYYRAGDPVQAVTAQVEPYRALGFTDFKIKVGGLPLAEDIARVRAARSAVGDDGRLALDANNAWRTVADALHAIRAFADLDIWWIEEPLMPDDLVGHAELARRSPVPIATGEIEATRWGFAQLIERRAAQILQPDAGVVGGVTEWMKITHAAAAFDIPIAPHWHANLHAQLAAAAANCFTVEYFAPDLDIYNFERLVRTPLRVERGRIVLDETPGLGFEIDEAAIDRYAI